MATTDYSTMSVEQLQAMNQDLMQQRAEATSAIEEEQLRVTEALDSAIARERLASQVQGMSEAERQVMGDLLANPPEAVVVESEAAVEPAAPVTEEDTDNG